MLSDSTLIEIKNKLDSYTLNPNNSENKNLFFNSVNEVIKELNRITNEDFIEDENLRKRVSKFYDALTDGLFIIYKTYTIKNPDIKMDSFLNPEKELFKPSEEDKQILVQLITNFCELDIIFNIVHLEKYSKVKKTNDKFIIEYISEVISGGNAITFNISFKTAAFCFAIIESFEFDYSKIQDFSFNFYSRQFVMSVIEIISKYFNNGFDDTTKKQLEPAIKEFDFALQSLINKTLSVSNRSE